MFFCGMCVALLFAFYFLWMGSCPSPPFSVYRVYHHYYWFWQISLCLEKKIHKILPKDFHIGWCYLFYCLHYIYPVLNWDKTARWVCRYCRKPGFNCSFLFLLLNNVMFCQFCNVIQRISPYHPYNNSEILLRTLKFGVSSRDLAILYINSLRPSVCL